MQSAAEVRARGRSPAFISLFFNLLLNKVELRGSDEAWSVHFSVSLLLFQFHHFSFLPSPPTPSPSLSLALHLYPPLCHTFSLPRSLPADFALPCVPPLIFSMAFLGASSLFPLSSSSSNHATQHIWRQRRLTEPVSLPALPPPRQLT